MTPRLFGKAKITVEALPANIPLGIDAMFTGRGNQQITGIFGILRAGVSYN